MREISEEERSSEVQTNIERGNHKSAEKSPEVVQKLLAKDVKHGFSLPINASAVKKIRGVMVQPCGLAIHVGRVGRQSTQVQVNTRFVALHHSRNILHQQNNRHGSISRNDLRVVPDSSRPLHISNAPQVPVRTNTNREVRLLRRLPKNRTLRKIGRTIRHHIGRSHVNRTPIVIRRISKPLIVV